MKKLEVPNYYKFVGIRFSNLLLGLSLLPLGSAIAQTNPCPRIYYEEPFNSTRPAPQGCPANAAAQQRDAQSPPSATPVQTPLPEQLQEPSAKVVPNNGAVNLNLVNQTGTTVVFEVIGRVDERQLAGRTNVTLQDLKLPINLTLVRPDGGFLVVEPSATAPGTLEVRLREAESVDRSSITLSIQEDGNVFLN
jgi:hypothetical protein